MLTPSKAAKIIIGTSSPLPSQEMQISAARGRVLAQDVISPLQIPPWTNSAMDGYAVYSKHLESLDPKHVELTVVSVIPAGAFPDRLPGEGECARIFTGAPLPDNCDTVIRQEDVTVLDGGTVKINDLRDLKRNVRAAGEDIESGDVVLKRGAVLGPAQIGVLSSIAQAKVQVHGTPTVAFMGSGDEIVDLDRSDEILSGQKIASSNSYTLQAMIEEAGAVPINLGIARDDPADLKEKLLEASQSDIVVTSAGISVGDHDYMRPVLDEMGAQQDFWRIQMRPGAPVGFGNIAGKPWIGLPGNPVSTMVTFELFVRPLIRVFQGHDRPFRRTVEVTLKDPVKLGPKLTHFLRIRVEENGEGLEARLTGPQGSGILTSMAQADALLIVPADRPTAEPGETMQAILLNDPIHVTNPQYQ
jgi:molybdopterin molybdotransferase